MTCVSIFMLSFTVALSGALAPGPMLAAVIYESSRRGARAGPLIVLGHVILELVMVALLMVGAARFITNPMILKSVAVTGAAILLLFGLQMLISVPKLALPAADASQTKSNLALTGITVSLANPYWTVWWVTIGLGLLLAAQRQGWAGLAAFFLGHILADLGWYSTVSLVMGRGRKFISVTAYRIVVGVCAGALVVFGLMFGIGALRG